MLLAPKYSRRPEEAAFDGPRPEPTESIFVEVRVPLSFISKHIFPVTLLFSPFDEPLANVEPPKLKKMKNILG